MLFVQSLGGLSHTAAEDTDEAHIELGVRALAALVERVLYRPSAISTKAS
jgi:N-carbamoyl-L-amino-acid hydrolase